MHIPAKSTRTNKKQLAAHLDPELVKTMKKYCDANHLTLQEVVAMSVNLAASKLELGKPRTLLQVVSYRLVKRIKSPSQVQTKGPDCRTGTMRIAAFFDTPDVERVRAFCKEKGIRQEHLIGAGLRDLLVLPGVEELSKAA